MIDGGPGMTADSSHRAEICIYSRKLMANACGRLFNPGPNGHSPMGIDSDMLSLFKALSPLAYESLHGNEKKTTVERFLENHPAPVGVRL